MKDKADEPKTKDVENETIDENQIVDYILQKFNEKLNDKEHIFYVITERGELYELSEYETLHKENPNTSKACIFIANLWFNDDPVRSDLLPTLKGEGSLQDGS